MSFITGVGLTPFGKHEGWVLARLDEPRIDQARLMSTRTSPVAECWRARRFYDRSGFENDSPARSTAYTPSIHRCADIFQSNFLSPFNRFTLSTSPPQIAIPFFRKMYLPPRVQLHKRRVSRSS